MKKIYFFITLISLLFLFQCQNKPISKKEILKPKRTIKFSQIYIGRLNINSPLSLKYPSEYCLEDGYLYKSIPHRIGDINLYSSTPQKLDSFNGKSIIAYGIYKKDLNQILKKSTKCPENYGRKQSMMQLRSDWVSKETGFRIGRSTKEKLKSFQYLEYSKITEFKGFNIVTSKNSKEIKVNFKNNLNTTLQNLSIIAQYESMRGKPRPYFKRKEFKDIAQNKTISIFFQSSFEIPGAMKNKRRSTKAILRNIIIKGDAPQIKINIKKNIRFKE